MLIQWLVQSATLAPEAGVCRLAGEREDCLQQAIEHGGADGDGKYEGLSMATVMLMFAVEVCCDQVEEAATSTHQMQGTRDVSFELSKQSLQTMLDGLGKIRKQLDAVA